MLLVCVYVYALYTSNIMRFINHLGLKAHTVQSHDIIV